MPVELADYDAEWPVQFAEAQTELVAILGPAATIEHIGSTSIPGCRAQPIVDVLVQLQVIPVNWESEDALGALGYTELLGDAGVNQMFYRKAPPTKVHVAVLGGIYATDRLQFRDYLREHPERRNEYEALKQELAAAHPSDQAAYTAGKHAYVEATIALASPPEA